MFVDLSTILGANPPPAVTPNFVNPPTQEALPKIFIYVTLPPMVIFLGLRIYTRNRYTVLSIDDFIGNPAGPHIWDIPLTKLTVDYGRSSIIVGMLYFLAAFFIKASFLALYRRIFRPSNLANLLIWICIILTVVSYSVIIILVCVFCVPRAHDYSTGGWLSPVFIQRCDSMSGGITIALGALGTFLDLYILLIPIIFLSRLRTHTKRKAGLVAIFAVGTAYVLYRLSSPSAQLVSQKDQDLTWGTMPIYAMNIGEINVGIMSSCMPVIFVLFKSFTTWSASWVTKLWSLTSRSQRQNNSTQSNDIQPPHYSMMDERNLPAAPKASLTRLKLLMRNFDRTNPAKTQTTKLSLAYVSIDYDYHTQLKQQVASQVSPQRPGY
ncbi:hypothetical protein F4801DRAFT_590342 [Xylaria longipes]|nr:hypothetical protein F4801DRAFT_590342 [Xylaria longipes]